MFHTYSDIKWIHFSQNKLYAIFYSEIAWEKLRVYIHTFFKKALDVEKKFVNSMLNFNGYTAVWDKQEMFKVGNERMKGASHY